MEARAHGEGTRGGASAHGDAHSPTEQDAVVGRLCGSSYVTGGAKFPEPEDPFVYHGANSALHRARPQSVQLKQV